MECIYSVDLNPYFNNCNGRNKLCSLSNKNVLALALNEYICVLPLEKPNELIPINEINNQCTNLCWNDDGTHLLSIHKDGYCYVYSLKNGVLNNFEIIHSFQLNNCKVSVAKWLNKTPKFYFNWSKIDSTNFLEKYYQKTYNTLKNFGKYANNGFIILDKSGKIHIRLTDLNTIKSSFDKFEYKIDCEPFDLADLIFDDNDNIVIACTKYELFAYVNIYHLKLEITNDGLLEGHCERKSTFSLQAENISMKTHLLFCHSDHRNSICIATCTDQNNLYTLNFWNYSSQYMNTSEALFEFNENGTWSCEKSISCNAGLIALNPVKFPIKYDDLINGNSSYLFYLIASYDDGTVGYIDRVNYNQTISQPLNSLTESNSSSTLNASKQKYIIKKQRITEYLTTLDQSLTGTIGVGITNANRLIVFRQSYLKDSPTSYFLNFYEYLMFSGNDYWDLLACMRQKVVDPIIERLEERYLGQPLYSIQRAFFMRYYSLLFSLYRQSTNGQIKAFDILNKLELNRCTSIISYSIQSIPNFNETNLNNFMQTNSLVDLIDESLKYELKINLSDIAQNIINRKNIKIVVNQQLKHLFQWIIDIALYLISISTTNKQQQQQQHQVFGLTLLNDIQFLNEIRKCLIYIKILFITANNLSNSTSSGTSQQQQQGANATNTNQNTTFLYSSLPVLPVRSSSTKDLISDLFSIYTKFYNKFNDKNQNSTTDDLLQDQCLNIQSETLIQPMDELLQQIKLPWLGINVSSKSCLKLSIEQQFNEERFNRKDYPLFDIIRFIYFSRSQFTRQCIRCGNYSEMIANDDTNTTKNNCIYILDSSSDKCICGGLWILTPVS